MIEFGTTRDVNKPYEVWRSKSIGWEWRVLKKYKSSSELCRCYCAVKSPFTGTNYDLSDVCINDIISKGGFKIDIGVVNRW
jgi:hypothetical protein